MEHFRCQQRQSPQLPCCCRRCYGCPARPQHLVLHRRRQDCQSQEPVLPGHQGKTRLLRLRLPLHRLGSNRHLSRPHSRYDFRRQILNCRISNNAIGISISVALSYLHIIPNSSISCRPINTNGAPNASTPKIFFRYYVNSSTGEKSGTMLAEVKWAAAAAGGGEP